MEPPSGAARSERSRPVNELAQRMSRKGNSAAHSEWRLAPRRLPVNEASEWTERNNVPLLVRVDTMLLRP